jgi:hypothetical protein
MDNKFHPVCFLAVLLPWTVPDAAWTLVHKMWLLKCRGKCLNQRRTKQLNNCKILCKNRLRNWHRSAATVKWLQ